MARGIIYDIMRYALHDGPGIRTTVFFKGCPLNCLWCANPESQARDPEFIFYRDRCIACEACVDVCHENAIGVTETGYRKIDPRRCTHCNQCTDQCYSEALQRVGRPMGVDSLVTEILKDHEFFLSSSGGVTFSGGDPLFQPRFLKACLKACKNHDLHTAVETSGAFPWELIQSLLPLTDLFLFDLKLASLARHRQFTNVSNQRILENLKNLVACHPVIIRIPMIPGINDRGEAWEEIQDFLEQLPWRGPVDLLPYHRMGLGKYEALNRSYSLDPELVSDMEMICQRRDQLAGIGFDARFHDR